MIKRIIIIVIIPPLLPISTIFLKFIISYRKDSITYEEKNDILIQLLIIILIIMNKKGRTDVGCNKK